MQAESVRGGGLSRATAESTRTRRYHAHRSGLLYIGFTLLLALGAINSQNNLLFMALGLTIGGLLISGILSGASLMGVRVERIAPRRALLGHPMRLRYRVTNTNRLVSAFGLHVVESHAPERGARGGNAPWPRFFSQPRTFVVHVPPSDSTEAELIITPRARGAIDLQSVQVWTTFPFGLAKKSVTFDLKRTILILPPDLPLKSNMLRRLTTRSQSGVGAENLAGAGEEFFGLREYVAGDSLRQIAWKRTARTGEIVVRQNAAPSPPRLWIMLNFSAPAAKVDAADNQKALTQAALDERCIALAASVLRAASKDGMAISLSIPAARVHHPAREGKAHLDRLLTDLALLDPDAIRADPSGELAAPSRGGTCIIIHAGQADLTAGPPGSHHIAADHVEQHLVKDDPLADSILGILDASGTEPRRARRFGRLRSAVSRPSGAGTMAGGKP